MDADGDTDTDVDGDTDADSDTDPDTDADTDSSSDTGTGGESDTDEFNGLGIAGRVEVSLLNGTEAPEARAQFFDGLMRVEAFAPFPGDLQEVVLAEGDCTYYQAAGNACDPPCDTNEYCSPTGCAAYPTAVSVGDISVVGEASSVTLQFDTYGYTTETLTDEDFREGDIISASAPGDTVGGFDLSETVPNEVTFDLGGDQLDLVDGQDAVITWQPMGTGTVQMILNLGWHGEPPTDTIVCEVPAAGGELVIPESLIEAFPPWGGVGLFQHSSWLSHINRAQVEGDDGTVELVVSYRQGFAFLHVVE
jgi:hypothetical protein